MGVHTFSIDDNIKQKFKQNTPERKTSQELQKLMEEYLKNKEVEIEETKSQDLGFENPIDIRHLTDKQKKLFYCIYRNNYFGKNKASIQKKAVNKHGVYSRTRSYKEGIQALAKSDDVPIAFKGSDVIAQDFECPKCGSSTNLSEVIDYNGECFWCDGEKFQFFKDGKVKA